MQAASQSITPQLVLNRQSRVISGCFLNAHLFGKTGYWQEHKMRFVMNDEIRAEQIAATMNSSNADFWVLAESWDVDLAQMIKSSVRTAYPHSCSSSYGDGLNTFRASIKNHYHKRLQAAQSSRSLSKQALLPLLSRLAGVLDRNVHGVGKLLASSFIGNDAADMHVMSRLKAVFPHDYILQQIENAFEGQTCWGGGLEIFSRYPLVGPQTFHPFPDGIRTEYERLVQKGVMDVKLQLPNQKTVSLYATHMQQGTSMKAAIARTQQLKFIRQLIQKQHEISNGEPSPTLILGDLNVIAEVFDEAEQQWQPNPEYNAMLQILGAVDAFRETYPNATDVPGVTYEPGNAFEALLAGTDPDTAGPGQRLDYILHRGLIKTIKMASFPLMSASQAPLSDHNMLTVQLLIP